MKGKHCVFHQHTYVHAYERTGGKNQCGTFLSGRDVTYAAIHYTLLDICLIIY